MSRGFLVAVGGGVAALAVLIGVVLYQQRGARLVLAGEITNIRTLGMDEKSSVVLVDFEFTNPAQYPFIVGSTAMSITDQNGGPLAGRIISAGHTQDLFAAFPAIGARTGESLVIKQKIAAGESLKVTLAARFEIPKLDLDQRKSLTVTVTEVDGTATELTR